MEKNKLMYTLTEPESKILINFTDQVAQLIQECANIPPQQLTLFQDQNSMVRFLRARNYDSKKSFLLYKNWVKKFNAKILIKYLFL